MADSIWAPGPSAAPVSYTVPGSSEIVPLACNAVFNGSGAGGDYVPALIFRDQAGHVIARVPTAKTVTAGDDAEVSWFPGGRIAATSASTPTTLRYCQVITGPSASFEANMPITSFVTNDPTNYVQLSATSWQIPLAPHILLALGTNDSVAATLTGYAQIRVSGATGYLASAAAPDGVWAGYIPYIATLLFDGFSETSPWRTQIAGTNTDNWDIQTYMISLAPS